MKGFYKITVSYFIVLVGIWSFMNMFFSKSIPNHSGRDYRVHYHRLEEVIKEKGYEAIDLSQYPSIIKVTVLGENDNREAFFEGGNKDYAIREIKGKLYRFDYQDTSGKGYQQMINAMNVSMLMILLSGIIIVLYVEVKLIRPFRAINDLPYQLSKGNMKIPLKEDKNKYFGKLIWGLEHLREQLEAQKEQQLKLQKQKKMMLLSISHDIKTPLSAIKLYSTALTRGLYNTEQKQIEAANHIYNQAENIERFVLDLTETSCEDFLYLDVKEGEFYIGALVGELSTYYKEKLELLKIPIAFKKANNCLVKGDLNRAIEVLQNIMENAIKYGDGKGILLTTTNEEECVVITVSNTGCNLREEELPHLFDSFFRGSNVGNNKGSGLGLYICRELMKRMDGEVLARCKEDAIEVVVVFRK